MNSSKFLTTFVTLVTISMVAACSDGSTASRMTAKAVITTAMNEEGDPSTNELILQQPEVQTAIDCIANKLDATGWSKDQYEFFMKETGGTGNMKMINRHKFNDDEAMEHFGALFTATSTCM